ncbi:unnamed protein product [Alopecurus aequalis]
MAPSKLAFFLALNLALLAATAHSCSYCPSPVPVPTPPKAVPPPAPVTPTPVPPTGGSGFCSIDMLKLSVCANVLNLLKLNLGVPSNNKCCPLLSGLVNLDAAVCLCTAIKANVLGINLNVPVDLVLLLNQCGKTCPSDFTCPN